MILLTTTDAVRYTPPWFEGKDGAPVYLLRAGSVIERAQVEAELAGEHRAGPVWAWELRDAIREGLEKLLDPGEEREHLLALVELDEETPLEGDDRLLMGQAREVLGEHWPPYRELLSRLERRRAMAPIVAFRRFCVGIEGVDYVFERGPDGLVRPDTLKHVEPTDLAAAGARAFALLFADPSAKGNSAPPSKSDDGLAISNSDQRSPAGGRSTARGGRRTPSKRSRRGASASSTSG